MNLRPVTIQDTGSLYEFRQEAEKNTPGWKGQQATWYGHCEWLRLTMRNPQNRLWIVEHDGQEIGTGRTVNGYMAIMLTRTAQGQGLGKQVYAAVTEQSGQDHLKVWVPHGNFRPMRCLLACGWQMTGADEDNIYMEWNR